MYKYPVIVFEGIETSGKSTNLNIAANFLKKKGKVLLNYVNQVGVFFQKLLENYYLTKN